MTCVTSKALSGIIVGDSLPLQVTHCAEQRLRFVDILIKIFVQGLLTKISQQSCRGSFGMLFQSLGSVAYADCRSCFSLEEVGIYEHAIAKVSKDA